MWHYVGKKARGDWGEKLVDRYMESIGWQCALRNWRIPGGEIDRVYEKHVVHGTSHKLSQHVCICEIKLVTLPSAMKLEHCLSEVFLSKLLKRRQLQNLVRMGEHLAATKRRTNLAVHLYARLCVAFRFGARDGDLVGAPVWMLPGKICMKTSDYLLLSLQPELVVRNSQSSRIQVQIPDP